jgi:hypothetical protein
MKVVFLFLFRIQTCSFSSLHARRIFWERGTQQQQQQCITTQWNCHWKETCIATHVPFWKECLVVSTSSLLGFHVPVGRYKQPIVHAFEPTIEPKDTTNRRIIIAMGTPTCPTAIYQKAWLDPFPNSEWTFVYVTAYIKTEPASFNPRPSEMNSPDGSDQMGWYLDVARLLGGVPQFILRRSKKQKKCLGKDSLVLFGFAACKIAILFLIITPLKRQISKRLLTYVCALHRTNLVFCVRLHLCGLCWI